MVVHARLSATNIPAKHEVTKPRFDIRELIRHFAPQSDDPRLLRWNQALDREDGTGVRVALLDSGICWSHPMFRGAEIRGRDFTESGGVFDPTGHGTKNAGLLVGQGGKWMRGLTPACTLLVGKVLGTTEPDSDAKALAQGLRWAVQEGAHLVILPLGRVRGSSLVAQQVRRALKEGCVLFAAAGNRGPDTFLFPARLPGVKAVSAANLDGVPLEWCCQVSQVDCYAPGEDVWSIGLEGASTVSGSSLATVLVGGVAALQQAQKHRLEEVG